MTARGRPADRLGAMTLPGLFTLTGFGCALLGASLPALLARWSLGDRGGGFLFFCAWLGAALGALLSRGELRRSILRGTLLAAGAALGLALLRGRAVFALALLYGVGLGIVMTSISLLRAREAGPRRGSELNRLNLLWALGALITPSVAAHALRTGRPAYLFAALSAALLGFACLPALFLKNKPACGGEAPEPGPEAPLGSHAPLLLCSISALIVGTEASLAAWLTTFSRRAGPSLGEAVGTGSAFWAGLLLSRALHSGPLFGGEPRLRPYAAVLAAALVLLLFATGPAPLAVLAFVLGAALGPLYPFLLAIATARYRGNRVFLAAGLGSAVFPWLTGLLSAAAGSLRAGLAVPCAAACVLLALSFRVNRR